MYSALGGELASANILDHSYRGVRACVCVFGGENKDREVGEGGERG